MLTRLATTCYRRRRVVLVIWVLLLIGLSVLARQAGEAFSQSVRLPASDSQRAAELLSTRFPDAGSQLSSGEIVVRADAGITDPAVQARLTTLFAAVAELDGVQSVDSPYAAAPAAAFQRAPDGLVAYAPVAFDASSRRDIPAATLAEIGRLTRAAATDSIQIELGGNAFEEQGALGSEWIGLLAAVVILLLAFGSVVAMGLPILTALFGLGVGFATVALMSHVLVVPDFATQLAAMIGLGVGIDYALFIVTRYRQGLAAGLDPERATITAIDTAGRAVIFAGCTVVISLAGMLLIGIDFIRGLGLTAAAVVAITMLASITLLPATLGFVGRSIDRLRIPGIGNGPARGDAGFWARWSRRLQAHPVPYALAGLAVLLLLAMPVLSMRLGSSDASNLPTSTSTRRAYDIKADGFGAGASGPLLVVAEIPAGANAANLTPVVTRAIEASRDAENVASVSPPRVSADGRTALFVVTPRTSAQDAATSDLIRTLRADTLPGAGGSSAVVFHVGGVTATFDDLAHQLQARLPIFMAVVLALSFLLLMVVFRSILVPLKAVLMNLLSIGAAYGVVVAVFQNGWGAGLFGVGGTGPIESFLPMMMFAILFGLSMDYEVFLLSRIKEEYDRSGDNAAAVVDGLVNTARVITAAALIMVTVFGSFLLDPNRIVKMFGLGLSVAILLDATLVRLVLVPATMALLGEANWWFPRWLRWIPVVHVEGTAVDTGESEASEPGPGAELVGSTR